jgi:hypothetical protein
MTPRLRLYVILHLLLLFAYSTVKNVTVPGEDVGYAPDSALKILLYFLARRLRWRYALEDRAFASASATSTCFRDLRQLSQRAKRRLIFITYSGRLAGKGTKVG